MSETGNEQDSLRELARKRVKLARWSPWLIWVALVWGFYVALSVVVIHSQRPVSDREVERELERLAVRS
jgi:hypothetical protein